MHKAYLGLGANIGDRERTITRAVEEIGAKVGRVTGRSSLYETVPWGYVSANMYLNAVVCCRTALSPHALLEATQDIERMLGRTEKTTGTLYHDRPIDIDILLYDNIRLSAPGLIIPHPRMRERSFVMTPLQELIDMENDARKEGPEETGNNIKKTMT